MRPSRQGLERLKRKKENDLPLFRNWFKGSARARTAMTAKRKADLATDEVRRSLLVLAVRDALQKHGIPYQWISTATHPALTATRARGMHLTLVVREWQPRLLPYSLALQRVIIARLMRLDPLSPNWVTGVSWRYDLVDDSTCPALPKGLRWAEAPDDSLDLPCETHAAISARDSEFADNGAPAEFRATVPMPL